MSGEKKSDGTHSRMCSKLANGSHVPKRPSPKGIDVPDVFKLCEVYEDILFGS